MLVQACSLNRNVWFRTCIYNVLVIEVLIIGFLFVICVLGFVYSANKL